MSSQSGLRRKLKRSSVIISGVMMKKRIDELEAKRKTLPPLIYQDKSYPMGSVDDGLSKTERRELRNLRQTLGVA
jgi:hypothetical protein